MTSPTTTSNPGPATSGKLRGFAVRALVAAGLIAIVAASLIWWMWGLVILVAVLVALAAHELGHAAQLKGWHPVWQVAGFGGAALILLEYGVNQPPATNAGEAILYSVPWFFAPLTLGLIGCAVLVLVAWVWRLRRPVDGFLADSAVSSMMVVYLPLLATFVVAMALSARPAAQIATFIACIAFNDTGAYVMGSLLGRHKMTPHISPAKTWEGFAGGLVWAAVAGALLVQFVFYQPWWQGVVLGLVLGTCATLGDLVESAIKRDVGVKDMGKLLPGHGGAMDRVDSLLFCAPVAWALLNLWICRGPV